MKSEKYLINEYETFMIGREYSVGENASTFSRFGKSFHALYLPPDSFKLILHNDTL